MNRCWHCGIWRAKVAVVDDRRVGIIYRVCRFCWVDEYEPFGVTAV